MKLATQTAICEKAESFAQTQRLKRTQTVVVVTMKTSLMELGPVSH